jgi:hypothetical protein
MGKHLSVLRRFEVSSDDGGGIWIDHRWKACDWGAWADGHRLTDLMKQASDHARVCDGTPQPRPVPPCQAESPVPRLWADEVTREVTRSLGASLVLPRVPESGSVQVWVRPD